MSTDISVKIHKFIKNYLEMKIDRTVINCPYWMNKMKDGKVILKGFLGGKGSAQEIRQELISRLKQLPTHLQFPLTKQNLQKFAKRERLGIDCSGFAYRLLNELIHLNNKKNIHDLSELFPAGIGKTDANSLSDSKYCQELDKTSGLQLGDLIRLWGGKHIAVILEKHANKIVYIHSSHLSYQTQGVHIGKIGITDEDSPLDQQNWLEKTRKGENFGKKYFQPQNGDGVFRLKIFN